ncbi:MAG: glycogen synthase GlgA [Betaproteobacteria bacterium]|nr:glycogen synthase GlgA [Betaproteobacteria bacterium]
MRVLFVTPECAPLAKTGGLGDVSAALPAALRQLGIDVRVLLPGYPGVFAAVNHARELARLTLFEPPLASRLLETRLATGVPLMILDNPPLYRRDGGPYQNASGEDWRDNGLRFGLLSKAAAVLGSTSSPLPWRPQVIHCHDWPAALACAYLHYASGPRAANIVTVHNLAFQGNFDPGMVASLGLPPASYAADGLEFHGRMSFLKAGLVYADAITTVSPTYAHEIQSEACGAGMHRLLQRRRSVLSGILNGIDAAAWNPATDPYLPHHYRSDALERKRLDKQALQDRLQLAHDPDDVPLLGVVSRLTHQKGADLLVQAALELAALPAQLVILGSGQREHEDALRALAAHAPGRIAVTVGFDEALAHLIEAGADMFLMPSRFEPCGLNQMYSQRYGTPPIAHATGGLTDTIVDYSPGTLAAGNATGFLFDQPTVAALLAAVRRAVAVYRERDNWRMLQQNGMARDFSWIAAARQYAELYLRLAARRGSPP